MHQARRKRPRRDPRIACATPSDRALFAGAQLCERNLNRAGPHSQRVFPPKCNPRNRPPNLTIRKQSFDSQESAASGRTHLTAFGFDAQRNARTLGRLDRRSRRNRTKPSPFDYIRFHHLDYIRFHHRRSGLIVFEMSERGTRRARSTR